MSGADEARETQRLDEQLRQAYMQFTKNVSMDIKNVMHISHTYRISPHVARDAYQRLYPHAHKGLTCAQFVRVMRQALGVAGGGDPSGLTDRCRDLHRLFSLPDAPGERPGTARPTENDMKRQLERAAGQHHSARNKDGDTTSAISNSIRDLESTIVLRETQRGAPMTPSMTSRFFDSAVTPRRRLGTACFLPSRRNLTVVSKRPTTSDRRAGNVRGNGGNYMGLFGKTPYSVQTFGESPWETWAARAGEESAKYPFAPPPLAKMSSACDAPLWRSKAALPGTAAQLSRTSKLENKGTVIDAGAMSLQTLTEDAADQARALIKHISARLRRQKVQHIDVLLPFEHYDPDKSGQVGVQHARVALAELDCILSESAVREMAAVADALGKSGGIRYHRLASVLSPPDLPQAERKTKTALPGDVKKRPKTTMDGNRIEALSVQGLPADLGRAMAKLAKLASQHRQEINWQASKCRKIRTLKTFGEQVRALDYTNDGTCQPVELKTVMTTIGLPPKQADVICDYFVGDNNKCSPLGERGLIRYVVLLNMMHRQMSSQGLVAASDSCPVFPTESVRTKAKLEKAQKSKTIGNIPEPSERRRLGLGAVYKKVNAEVESTAKLRTIFEASDPSNTGSVSLDAFQRALEQVCVRLTEDETTILMEQLDKHDTGQVEYSKFFALMLPPSLLKEDAIGYKSLISAFTHPIFGKNTGPESLTKSMEAMKNLPTEDILKIFKDGCKEALAKGPERLRREHCMFRLPGDTQVTKREVQRFAQDFGLHLTSEQCSGLLRAMHTESNGASNLLDFMKLVLPKDANVKQGRPRDPVIQELADDDFYEGMTARLQRQLLRKGVQGEAAGVQLRKTFGSLLGQHDVLDADVLRALLDHGVVVDKKELTKYLDNFRSTYSGRVSLRKFIEVLEPEAFHFVFPTHKDVGGGGSFGGAKIEVNLGDRDADPHMYEGIWLPMGKFTNYNRIGHREVSDQEVRNCLRRALAMRLCHDGGVGSGGSSTNLSQQNIIKELRECDSQKNGTLGIEDFKRFLLKLGLKIEERGNVERLWFCLAGQQQRLDIMQLADKLMSDYEGVPRKSREQVREPVTFR